jgi:isopenicillin N synthase-like dioxygenase
LADDKRQVTYAEAQQLARKLGLAGFVETSAKDGTQSINDAFFIACTNSFDTHVEAERRLIEARSRSRARTNYKHEKPTSSKEEYKEREQLMQLLKHNTKEATVRLKVQDEVKVADKVDTYCYQGRRPASKTSTCC